MKMMQYTKWAALLAPFSLGAVIDWDGDTSKTASGLETWIIAEAAYASTAPTIDGVISAGEWDAATRYPLEEVYHITNFEGEMEASFAVKWDQTYLYFLIEATDSVGMSGQGHKFEIYISTGFSRNFGAWQLPGYEDWDYQVVCTMYPEDTFYELGFYSFQTPLPSFTRANTVDGMSYVSEVRIAWADLGGLPADRGLVNVDYIGFEVHTQRDAPAGMSGGNRTKLGWAGIADTAWAATEDWGTLRLMPASGDPDPQPDPTWAGFDIVDGWVDTGALMGMLYVAHAPWVYSSMLERYVYLPESGVMDNSLWLYKSR